MAPLSILAAGGIYKLVDELAAPPRRVSDGLAATPSSICSTGSGSSGTTASRCSYRRCTTRSSLRPCAWASVPASSATPVRSSRAPSGGSTSDSTPTPAGLGVTVAWGTSVLRALRSRAGGRHLPDRRRATASRRRAGAGARGRDSLPERPGDDGARGKRRRRGAPQRRPRPHRGGAKSLFDDLGDLFRVTSIRQGFVGGGFDGGKGLPKQMALAAGIAGRRPHPGRRRSSSSASRRPRRRASARPGSRTSRRSATPTSAPEGYFAARHPHASLASVRGRWRVVPDVRLSGSPRHDVSAGPRCLPPRRRPSPQGPDDAQTDDRGVAATTQRHRRIGHSGSIQPASRLDRDVVGADGERYAKGNSRAPTGRLQHARQPVLLDGARPDVTRSREEPAAGLHFVVFNPTSDDFRRTRLAMDGVLPDGTRLAFEPGSTGRGFNSILATTHRQNFLVLPAHTARSRSRSSALSRYTRRAVEIRGAERGYLRASGRQTTRILRSSTKDDRGGDSQ